MQQFETNENTLFQKTYVALRLRPNQSNEKFCEKVSNTQIRIRQPNSDAFQFDRVFDENEETQVVFDQMVRPMLDKSLSGLNALICAYGQTSSGKTYTMKGCGQQLGLIQYSANYLFNQFKKGSKIKMQYLEIYQEQIYDLLSHDQGMNSLKNQFNCQKVEVNTPDQLLRQYNFGENKRHFGETSMNIESSRSHVILQLDLSIPVQEGKALKRRVSQVLFVDLAGSEGASKDIDTVRKQEGSKINKSLLAFSNVVNKIKENQIQRKNEFINYRDSQLTLCLKTCLEGNSQLAFLFTINQNISCSSQSLITIQFSKNAGAIKSKLIVNEVISENSEEFDRIRELTQENQQLNDQIENQEKIIKSLKDSIENQNHSLSAVEKELREVKRNLNNLTIDYKILEKGKKFSQEMNQELKLQIGSYDKKIELLERLKQKQNKELEDQKESYQQKIANLEEQLQQLNKKLVDQKDIYEKKIANYEGQQQKQNQTQQKENLEPVSIFNKKPQLQQEIKNDVNKGQNSVIKQVKSFQDESLKFVRPKSLTSNKEQDKSADKSKKSPSIKDLNNINCLYIEFKTQRMKNLILKQKLFDVIEKNMMLQKQNDDYDKLLKHKLCDDEDFGDMKQFFENMEIVPEQEKKRINQIQPRVSEEQYSYNETKELLQKLKEDQKLQTVYVEQLFDFVELTYGQDRKQYQEQFAEWLHYDILRRN